MRKNVVHVAFAIVISSYLIWSSVNAEESPPVTQSPGAMEGGTGKSFLSSAFEPHFEKDFTASVGVKMWRNQWILPEGSSGQKAILSYTSGTETALIPVLSVRTKNWFVSGSYFTKTEYDFGTEARLGNTVIKKMLTGERTEWDINTGYYLHKYLLVTAGYKGIKKIFNVTDQISGHSATTRQITTKLSGPTLGIASFVPLQGRFGLYGNFAYGQLGIEDEDPVDYYLGDMGLLYSFKFAKVIDAASVSLGYRFQSLYYEANNGVEMRDGTEGFALGLTVTF